MVKIDGRYCDGCGQKLPPGSRLSLQAVAKEEAAQFGAAGIENSDGTVTVDLCLNCRVQRSNRIKHPER